MSAVFSFLELSEPVPFAHNVDLVLGCLCEQLEAEHYPHHTICPARCGDDTIELMERQAAVPSCYVQ